jgi:hypothetical protein
MPGEQSSGESRNMAGACRGNPEREVRLAPHGGREGNSLKGRKDKAPAQRLGLLVSALRHGRSFSSQSQFVWVWPLPTWPSSRNGQKIYGKAVRCTFAV